jgi:hypothetical protein
MESAAQAAASQSPRNPPIRVANPPRFDLTSGESKAAFLRYLDEHGYAVVASVADEIQVAAAKASFWAAANMDADNVLNPDNADCDSLWWPNKNTGARMLHVKRQKRCKIAQVFAAGPGSTTATSAGQLGCCHASASRFRRFGAHHFRSSAPMQPILLHPPPPPPHLCSDMGRRSRSHCLV